MASGRLAAALQRDGIFLLFALPFVALTIVFGLWPIVLSIEASFTQSATALRAAPSYVGWANYASVLADPAFLASLWRTLLYAAAAVAANLVFALAVAFLFDSPRLGRLRQFYKLAVFLPVVTPDVAGYVVWRWLYDQSFGALNAALAQIGLPRFAGIASADTAMLAVLGAELWHHAGFYMVIFLANLAVLDRGLAEAAAIDGAGWRQILWHVTLPQLRPSLVINAVYALIQFLKTFTVVVVMTKGGPAGATDFVSYHAYQLFDEARYGEATAMATILFAIVVVLTGGAYAAVERRRVA